MEKKSFIRKIIWMMAIQIALMLVVLVSFVVFSYWTAKRDMETSLGNLMELYGSALTNKLDNADMLLERLVYKNTDYELLQSEREAERFYASVELNSLIEESIAYASYVDAVIMAESTYGTCLDRHRRPVAHSERVALRSFTLESASGNGTLPQWSIDRIGDTVYIYKLYVWQGRVTGIYIGVDSFMDIVKDNDLDGMFLALTDKDGRLWASYGLGEKKQSGDAGPRAAVEYEYVLEEGQMRLTASVSAREVFSQIRLGMVGLLVIILFAILSAVLLLYGVNNEILKPMHHMRGQMELMQQGSLELRIEEEYGNREFSLLKETFNRLIDEIVGLKIKSYERQIELSEAELRCVKLQIRPHFFLNAMTTISSLSMQGRNAEIKTYIEALSGNIRYMFRSGLHTVALEEEIRHVENYFEMQELKYPGCVFYYIEMDEGCEKFPIPQMLIHTIIENEYKYAVSVDSLLTILIRTGKKEVDGKDYLLLEIEDDGMGYPEDVLEGMSGNAVLSEGGARVGLFGLKRMMELMYEEKGLFEIANIEPHGCKNIFRIPKKPVHEIKEE